MRRRFTLRIGPGKLPFTAAEIGKCYDTLHLCRPASFGAYFKQLALRKELLKAGAGYKLESKVREQLDAAYGKSEVTIKVESLLTVSIGLKRPQFCRF